MAIIATLKATENTSPASGLSTASIPLNKLAIWEGNVRKTDADKGLDELIASIEAHGVLQSLVVKKAARGKYSIIAGRRRYLALSALAAADKIAPDAPVPCQIIPGSTDSTEISLAENVVRAPMHPADQFEAFRALIDDGQSVADIAARFGIAEKAVKQRLKLSRLSPRVLAVYRGGELTLEQVQAFAITDDHVAQERVLDGIPDWHETPDADDIRNALTQDDIAATDKRARFVTIAAYEEAGGDVRRDLFAEGDEGVALLDPAVLDNLAMDKLRAQAEAVKSEGWKWVEAMVDFDQHAHVNLRVRRPEPQPLSEEAQAEQKQLSEEYDRLLEAMDDEGDEETYARLKQIEERISALQTTVRAYTSDTLAIAGAIVTIGQDGELEVVRGVVKPEDEPEEEARPAAKKPKPEFSAALVQSLSEAKSAAISAELAQRPDIALASVVYAMACSIFRYGNHSSLRISVHETHFKEASKGVSAMDHAREEWSERLPDDDKGLWEWCLTQDTSILLSLLAFCAASTVNAVESKHDRECAKRIPHANVLASALGLDMANWFTPTAESYFSRVGRQSIVTAITEAKGIPAKKSWHKQTKAAFAAFAEREIAGTGWLPKLLRAA